MNVTSSSGASTSLMSSAALTSDSTTRRPSNVIMHPPRPKKKKTHSTDPYLRDFTLVAEAARRAQMAIFILAACSTRKRQETERWLYDASISVTSTRSRNHPGVIMICILQRRTGFSWAYKDNGPQVLERIYVGIFVLESGADAITWQCETPTTQPKKEAI
ncbi:hypothetical protein F5Y19DRAFT_471111 [Xylariaceae sp. FL1651]|nr:hypothetical protein F5Y19DRAFT_471111 [Xylariaceae sp. FL1651]